MPKNKLTLLTFLFILPLLLLFVAGCSAPALKSTNEKQFEFSSYSSLDEACVCEDDQSRYYAEKEEEGYSLYRENKKDGNKAVVRSEEQISELILSEEWLYFAGSDGNICRIRTDGSDYCVILNTSQLCGFNEFMVSGLAVYGDILFIRTGFPLYSYDMKTGVATELSWDARSNFQVVGNKLYFCGKDFSISEMNIDTKEIKVILAGEDAWNKKDSKNLYKNFVFVNGDMYYYKRSPDGLFAYQNGESRLIDESSNINEYTLMPYNGSLYYVVYDDEASSLMKYDPESQRITKLLSCDDFSSCAKIIEGYFYYYADSNQQIQAKKIL